MYIIARVEIEYRNKDNVWETCCIRFRLTRKGEVGIWEEIKIMDNLNHIDPNYSFLCYRDRLHLVDTEREWIHNGIGRIKFKFQESDLSNYIGDFND